MDPTPIHPRHHPLGRIVPLHIRPRPGRRQGALEAVDASGCTVALAYFDGPRDVGLR
ncbi:MAG TPA: hypothetical protein VE623_23480 [Acidimicrobiales bacterium]|nr:hypothetical protein [Acidimicrobiales bacterium]